MGEHILFGSYDGAWARVKPTRWAWEITCGEFAWTSHFRHAWTAERAIKRAQRWVERQNRAERRKRERLAKARGLL